MSDEADINTGVVVEDKPMDKKGSELGENGSVTGQMTVTMTDKDPTWSTPCKGESKEVSLSELGSSPTGSFQSLQSSQSSEGGSGTSIIPPVGETRVLKFEDTLSEEDYRNFKLIYKSLLLEGRAGNLTNLTLEMVLAEKPPTWLPVMYERLKHLIINADAFREKVMMGHYPWLGGRERKVTKEWENNQGVLRLWKIEDTIVGRAANIQGHQETILRSGSAIGN